MNDYGYGLWALVVLNSVLFIVFAVSFFHPRSGRDWRVLGGFSAFVVALFTEMYGYPLTVYLLTGPLSGLVPGVDLSHNSGHLWTDLIGWEGDPHVSPFHLASYAFIIGGFWLIASGWRVLFAAQKQGQLATAGPYARVRHPQYAGFLLIMIGFLLQWPTFATLAMFPILVYVYRRLAIREERDVVATFGRAWDVYAAATPRFVPRRRASTAATPPGTSALEPAAGAELHENRTAASRALQTRARR
jgi:protein-S-isoprenylcysteine O-methyltransferase Ste14